MVIKTLDPDLLEMLDPDPDSMNPDPQPCKKVVFFLHLEDLGVDVGLHEELMFSVGQPLGLNSHILLLSRFIKPIKKTFFDAALHFF